MTPAPPTLPDGETYEARIARFKNANKATRWWAKHDEEVAGLPAAQRSEVLRLWTERRNALSAAYADSQRQDLDEIGSMFTDLEDAT